MLTPTTAPPAAWGTRHLRRVRRWRSCRQGWLPGPREPRRGGGDSARQDYDRSSTAFNPSPIVWGRYERAHRRRRSSPCDVVPSFDRNGQRWNVHRRTASEGSRGTVASQESLSESPAALLPRRVEATPVLLQPPHLAAQLRSSTAMNVSGLGQCLVDGNERTVSPHLGKLRRALHVDGRVLPTSGPACRLPARDPRLRRPAAESSQRCSDNGTQ